MEIFNAHVKPSDETRLLEMDDFSSLFASQTLVVDTVHRLLDLASVLACLSVSKSWNALWSENYLWLRVFSHHFFSLDLRLANHDMVAVLFPSVPLNHLVLAMYRAKSKMVLAGDRETACRSILWSDAPRPKFTRTTLYVANFIDTMRVIDQSRPNVQIEPVVCLQDEWERHYSQIMRRPLRGAKAFVARCPDVGCESDYTLVPEWLEHIVASVTFHHVVEDMGNRIILLSFRYSGLTYTIHLEPAPGKLKMYSCRRQKWLLCAVSEHVTGSDVILSGDWMSFVTLNLLGNLCPLARALKEHHPFHVCLSLADGLLLPVQTMADQYWWCKFAVALMGGYAPTTDVEPPCYWHHDEEDFWQSQFSSDDDDAIDVFG